MNKGMIRGIVALTLGSVLVAAPAAAQIKWQVGLGVNIPEGTFGDGFKTGLNAMGAANFGLTAKPISFRADLGYNINKCNVSGCGNVSMNLLTLSGDVEYNFPTPRAHPYLIGGATWGRASLGGSDAPSGIDPQSDFGFNLGGGLHWDMGAVPVFVEARYFDIGGNVDARFIPITFGVRF